MLCKQFDEIIEVLMNDNTVWMFLYYVVLFMHYFGIGLLISFLICRFGLFRAGAIWSVVWLGSGI